MNSPPFDELAPKFLKLSLPYCFSNCTKERQIMVRVMSGMIKKKRKKKVTKLDTHDNKLTMKEVEKELTFLAESEPTSHEH